MSYDECYFYDGGKCGYYGTECVVAYSSGECDVYTTDVEEGERLEKTIG